MDYYQVSRLGSLYFHEDYDSTYGSPDDAVIAFARNESPTAVRELLEELQNIVASDVSENDLRRVWDVADAMYEPGADDHWSHKAWFEHMRDLLTGDT